MRRTPLAILAVTLAVSGCASTGGGSSSSGDQPGGERHTMGKAHSNDTQEKTSATPRSADPVPAIARRCKPHPLSKPAPLGAPLCSTLAVLEVVKVHYDIGKSRINKGWRYQVPEDPTWVSIDFRVTRLTAVPSLSTSQMTPTLTDVDGRMATASGSYDTMLIPGHGTKTFRADYAFGGESGGSLKRLVVCNDFLSSPRNSDGCGLLTKGTS